MKSVLIIDDASFMRTALKTILEKNHFEIAGDAPNGAIGVQKYKELRPDIVTLDITMPVMDGIQALKEIKKFDPKARVVMITAMDTEFYVKEAVMNGAKGFIVKPFREDIVITTLNKV